MGPETTYSAVVHHPQLVRYLWEYPVGAGLAAFKHVDKDEISS